jgi:hypothetical protein
VATLIRISGGSGLYFHFDLLFTSLLNVANLLLAVTQKEEAIFLD